MAEQNFHLKKEAIREQYKPFNPINEETEEYMDTTHDKVNYYCMSSKQ